VTLRPLAALALVLACTRTAANHEELGDRLYAQGQYADALAEYQLGLKASPSSAPLHAKTAAAAAHLSDFEMSVAEYRALSAEDRSRTEEAADGLERVLRGALAAGERGAVAAAVRALREIAGRRPAGGNLLLITHGSVVFPLTGIQPAPAELVVLTPESEGRFRVAGRLTP